MVVFDYFFLKLYNRIIKSDIGFPRFYASVLLGGIININIILINTLLSKLDTLPYLFNKTKIILCLIIIAIIIFFRYNKNRIETINLRFIDDYFSSKKKVLNIIFILYLMLTIIASLILPLWKPGYLPKNF